MTAATRIRAVFRKRTGIASRRSASPTKSPSASTRWRMPGKFERIVLVAPPMILGELRKELHKEVEAKVAGEVAKTLTNHTLPDIEKLLTEH